MNPTIIERDALRIAGISGNGDSTEDVWMAFEKLLSEKPFPEKLSENGYEIRVYAGDLCTVHVGHAVSDAPIDPSFEIFTLPAAQYAAFDVRVANGYSSENGAINKWLETNAQGYSERLLGEMHCCVEYYDERFNGSESDSIVQIWIPIEIR